MNLNELNIFFKITTGRFLFGALMVAMLHNSQAFAQQSECGSVPTAEQLEHIVEMHGNLKRFNARNLDTVYVPIKVHIITRTNGTGGLSVGQVGNEIQAVNQHYKPAAVQFYMCDTVNVINNSDLYFFKKGTDESASADIYDQPNVLNIYFTGELYRTSNGGQDTSYLCGYAYFPGGPDRIFMANGCSTNGSTLAHEIGHYMGLLHTHDTGNGHELVNGSNCDTAGDLFCDTPADPDLSDVVNSSCLYTGIDTDSNGDAYTPDPTNLMSYSRKTCRNYFSPEQYTLISYTAWVERDYLIDHLVTDFSHSVNALDISLTNLTTGADSISWALGDGNFSTDFSPVHAYGDTGTYFVCLNTANTCVAETYCQYVDVQCNTLEATFTYTDPNTNDFIVEFSSGYSDSSWVNWDFGDGVTGFGPNVTHTYSQPGQYTVTLDVTNNCGTDTASILITVDSLPPIGIPQVNALPLKLFPNPVSGVLNLDVPISGVARVQIYSANGRLVLDEQRENNQPVQVDGLSGGIWFVLVSDGYHTWRGRFVKLAH